MSSPFSDSFHILDQNFPTPLEISDCLRPFLQERSMFLPIEDHNTNGIMFKELENENSALANTRIHRGILSEVSTLNYHQADNSLSSQPLEGTFLQENSTSLLRVNDRYKASGELDCCIFLGEEFQELAMNSISEGFYYNKDNPLPAFEESTTCELDPKLILDHEQENSLMEKTIKESTSTKENLTGGNEMDSSAILDQENAVIDNSNVEKELLQDNKVVIKEIKHRFRRLPSEKMKVQPNGEEGSSTSKKQEHNAKEKVRRMKLNASSLALGSLLPNSRRPKKRWSVPIIIDKVLEYILELKSETEELTLKKNSLVSNKIENKYKQPIEQN